MSLINPATDGVKRGSLSGEAFWRKILAITWPAFIELVMSTMFGMVDMIMVGRLGPAAIAAVGLTNQPFMILLAVFAAVNVGTTALVAWSIGGGDRAKARATTRQSLIVNSVLGLVISLLGILVACPVVRFMGAGPDTMADAAVYFRIVATGLLFQVITLGVTAALRGAGETRIPMLYNVGSNLLNVFGNYVLIYGKLGFPRWGVAGAAVSTSGARFIACLVGLGVLFYSHRHGLTLSLKDDYRPDWRLIKEIFSIGLPAAMEQFVLQSGLTIFARTVAGLGTLNFAAHQIGLNISGLTFSSSQAWSIAATTLVGQSLGAGEPEKARQYAHAVHRMAMVMACFISVLFVLLPHPLARLYTSDPATITLAATVLKFVALIQPGQSTHLSLAGALRGAGDTMYPLYASIAGIWGFRVVAAYLFVNIFHWGLIGAWVALVLDQYTRAAVILFRFRSGEWKYARKEIGGNG